MLNQTMAYWKKGTRLFVFLCLIISGQSALASGGKPADTYTKTNYPIVMVNGIYGFDTAIGVMDYWHGIIGEMTDGGATVYVANLQATGTINHRGEELLQFVETLKAQYGHSKFNFIGHSYGGPSIRYLHGIRPDLVASIMTMGSPHKGTDLAEGFIRINEIPVINDIVFFFGDLGAFIIDAISGHQSPGNQDSRVLIYEMSKARMAQWNQQYPAGVPTSECGEGAYSENGTHFFSMGGVAQITNPFDVIGDGLVAVTQLFFSDKDHDGMVNRCSNHFGQVIRDNYKLNHVDEINHILGIKALDAPNPKSIYRSHANRLKTLNL